MSSSQTSVSTTDAIYAYVCYCNLGLFQVTIENKVSIAVVSNNVISLLKIIWIQNILLMVIKVKAQIKC